MRSILRAMLALALLLGGVGGDWALAGSHAGMVSHDCCCGTVPSGVPDPCACPKPDGNRTPLRSACAERQVVVAEATRRNEPGERRIEPRPEPAGWAQVGGGAFAPLAISRTANDRDPDLGRHLARLSTFRI